MEKRNSFMCLFSSTRSDNGVTDRRKRDDGESGREEEMGEMKEKAFVIVSHFLSFPKHSLSTSLIPYSRLPVTTLLLISPLFLT